jgi:hypothetical protein
MGFNSAFKGLIPPGIKALILPGIKTLTLNLLTTTIVAPPSNVSKWQMVFNSAFKGLNISVLGYMRDVVRVITINCVTVSSVADWRFCSSGI